MSRQEYDKYLQLLQSDVIRFGVAEDNLSIGALDAVYLLVSRGEEVGQDAESIFNLGTDFDTSLIQEVQERWMEFKRDSSHLETLNNSTAPVDRALASEIKSLRDEAAEAVALPEPEGIKDPELDLGYREVEEYYQDLAAEEVDDLFYEDDLDEESLSWSEMSEDFETFNPVEDSEEPEEPVETQTETDVNSSSFQDLLNQVGAGSTDSEESSGEPDWSSFAMPSEEEEEEPDSSEPDSSEEGGPDWSSFAMPSEEEEESVSEEENSSSEPDWSSFATPTEESPDSAESESETAVPLEEQGSAPEGNEVAKVTEPTVEPTSGTVGKKVRYSDDEGENAILENVMGAYNFFRNVSRKRT